MATTPKSKPPRQIGGARAGAGRRPGSADVYQKLAQQRVRLTEAQALAKELANKQRAGELLERHAVEKSARLMHHAMAQFLRGLPDDLERKCGLPPSAVEALELAIDAATVELSERIAAALRTPCG